MGELDGWVVKEGSLEVLHVQVMLALGAGSQAAAGSWWRGRLQINDG